MFYSENNVFYKNNSIDKLLLSFSFLCCLFYNSIAWSDVSDITISDVTTRAFSVIWVSDEPVNNASIRIYIDSEGTDNITSSVAISTVSSSNALALGIVKIDVTGLENFTAYYIETITEGDLATIISPPDTDPLIQVITAIETTRSDVDNNPIVNDLIKEAIYDPNGIDVPPAGLLVLNVPEISQYPISAFIEESTEAEPLVIAEAIVDLNNLFDKTSSSSAILSAGEKLEIKKFRGLLCDIDNQVLSQIRRVPEHEETPVITELESPGACFSQADFNCDSRVSLEDLGTFAAQFGLEQPDCRLNPDLDFNDDGRVGLFDLGALSPLFGTSEE